MMAARVLQPAARYHFRCFGTIPGRKPWTAARALPAKAKALPAKARALPAKALAAAIYALSQLRDPSTRAAIEAHASHASSEVREYVKEALKTLDEAGKKAD